MVRKRTIALFGGSFNPPHCIHVRIVECYLSGETIDEVWVIPTGGHAFGKPLTPFKHRLKMCQLAFSEFGDRVKVLEIEHENRVHYSIETVRELKKQFPRNKWFWIIGSDAWAERKKWKEFDELARLAPPLVVGREGHKAEYMALKFPDLSSTLIRKVLSVRGEEAFKDLKELVPDKVLKYIRRHHLYENPALKRRRVLGTSTRKKQPSTTVRTPAQKAAPRKRKS